MIDHYNDDDEISTTHYHDHAQKKPIIVRASLHHHLRILSQVQTSRQRLRQRQHVRLDIWFDLGNNSIHSALILRHRRRSVLCLQSALLHGSSCRSSSPRHHRRNFSEWPRPLLRAETNRRRRPLRSIPPPPSRPRRRLFPLQKAQQLRFTVYEWHRPHLLAHLPHRRMHANRE